MAALNVAELDPNKHIGEWTQAVGLVAVGSFALVLLLRAMFCASKGRAVSESDAPELEEFSTGSGKAARRVDSLRVKAGRYVSAAPQLEEEDEPSAWGRRTIEGHAKPKKPKKPRRRDDTLAPVRHPL